MYGEQYWEGPPVYRYERHPHVYPYHGSVHAGPVDVYYGRRGMVRIGPLHVFWD
jgi:hypothetical protein